MQYGFTVVADWDRRVALPVYDCLGAHADSLGDLTLKQSEVEPFPFEMIAQCFEWVRR